MAVLTQVEKQEPRGTSLWLSKRVRERVGHLVLHLVLIGVGVTFLVPFVWMISTSLKQSGTEFVNPPQWIPNPIMWTNYKEALLADVPFLTYMKNTLIIAVAVTVGDVLVTSLSAYSFARLRWPGRNVLFMCVLATLMLPNIVTVIPTFLMMRYLGWIDTFLPLIVPAWGGVSTLGGAFSIFLFRQFFLTIPRDLDEAARVDGATPLRVWWSVMLPLSGPVLATVVIFDVLNSWNDFFNPLIYLDSQSNFTMALGLGQYVIGHSGTLYNLEMAAATVMTIPVLVLFFVAQRSFIGGIATTGLAAR
ncbi:MAG TPA: carbohydrate ABC transporter permease [Chloroflexota bacterium]|nr:carbohydrate ABC transporter permease [Chloroflexota bacterium]